MELLLSVDGALKAVVKKLPGDRRPGGVGGGVRPVDVVPDLLRHRVVEPGGDAGIHLKPLRVVEHGGGVDRAINVVDEAEFLDGQLEEGTPLAEVPIVRGEDDRNVVADVQQHKSGGWGRSRVIRASEWVGGTGRSGNRTGHG